MIDLSNSPQPPPTGSKSGSLEAHHIAPALAAMPAIQAPDININGTPNPVPSSNASTGKEVSPPGGPPPAPDQLPIPIPSANGAITQPQIINGSVPPIPSISSPNPSTDPVSAAYPAPNETTQMAPFITANPNMPVFPYHAIANHNNIVTGSASVPPGPNGSVPAGTSFSAQMASQSPNPMTVSLTPMGVTNSPLPVNMNLNGVPMMMNDMNMNDMNISPAPIMNMNTMNNAFPTPSLAGFQPHPVNSQSGYTYAVQYQQVNMNAPIIQHQGSYDINNGITNSNPNTTTNIIQTETQNNENHDVSNKVDTNNDDITMMKVNNDNDNIDNVEQDIKEQIENEKENQPLFPILNTDEHDHHSPVGENEATPSTQFAGTPVATPEPSAPASVSSVNLLDTEQYEEYIKMKHDLGNKLGYLD